MSAQSLVWPMLGLLTLPLLGLGLWQCAGLVLSLIAIRKANGASAVPWVPSGARVAILYPTCDDFSAEACSSLLSQAGVSTELFLLDDSTEAASRAVLDAWANAHVGKARVIRREDPRGFKAGNLNHWLHSIGAPQAYQFALLVDADGVVPANFTLRLLEAIERSGAAFAQACHAARPAQTPFQSLMDLHVAVNWRHVIAARNLTGLPWMLGHGVLLRTADLRAVGGFPEVVSEDLALTIALAERGRIGVAATEVLAWEEFPRFIGDYWRRLSRWISADVELVLKVLPRLWRTRLHLTPKIDLTLRELRLPLLACAWLMLATLSLSAVLAAPSPGSRLPPVSWLIVLALSAPHLAACLLPGVPFGRGAMYCFTMPFLAHAGLAIYPPAVWTGLRGHCTFHPTGSDQSTRPDSPFALWEYGSGAVFVGAGAHSANLPLIAVGLAIFLAPLLRRPSSTLLLVGGASIFWSCVVIQLWVDTAAGSTRMEHLLPLAAIGAATD